jgi:predicted small secreted protein
LGKFRHFRNLSCRLGEPSPGIHPPYESNAMKKIVAILVLVACTASFAKKTVDGVGKTPVQTPKKK